MVIQMKYPDSGLSRLSCSQTTGNRFLRILNCTSIWTRYKYRRYVRQDGRQTVYVTIKPKPNKKQKKTEFAYISLCTNMSRSDSLRCICLLWSNACARYSTGVEFVCFPFPVYFKAQQHSTSHTAPNAHSKVSTRGYQYQLSSRLYECELLVPYGRHLRHTNVALDLPPITTSTTNRDCCCYIPTPSQPQPPTPTPENHTGYPLQVEKYM